MILLSSLKDILLTEQSRLSFKNLYGQNQETNEMQRQRYLHLAALFEDQYPGHKSAGFFSTPGRVEISGNHTDHQNGKVLCAAVDLDIIAAVSTNSENVIRLKSEGYEGMDCVELDSLNIRPDEQKNSASLIRGVAAGFCKSGCKPGGLDIYTTSLVPKGSGLSSSAAFEIMLITVLDTFFNDGRLSPVERAKIAQYAENVYFGKPSGLMDQCGCSVGGIIAINFADQAKPDVKAINFDFDQTGFDLVITHTGGSHADLTDDYASIPAEMNQVASAFGCRLLSELNAEEFYEKISLLRDQVSDRALLRAIHYFEENNRVSAQIEALNNFEFDKFLELLKQSGISSWTKLQNLWSVKSPLEQPLALALALSDRLLGSQGAARVHGGGFAGTIQAFVPKTFTETYRKELNRVFGSGASVKMSIRKTGSCPVILK